MNRDGSGRLGSARGSRAGEGARLRELFCVPPPPFGLIGPEIRFGEAPKPARELHALARLLRGG